MNKKNVTRFKALLGTGLVLVVAASLAIALLPKTADAYWPWSARARVVRLVSYPRYTVVSTPAYRRPAVRTLRYTVIPGYRTAPAYRPYGYRTYR